MALSGATISESVSNLYTKPFGYPALMDAVMFYSAISSTDVAKGQYSTTLTNAFLWK